MNICGIVSEYNPFHNGHAYQLSETRKKMPSDTAVVSVMSGNFVQRGDFAIMDKYKRAEMAVRSGVDLVVELPLAAALSSAEGFAKGAIDVLHELGCRTVSFGAENADADFQKAALLLDTLDFTPKKGISYAAARQCALRKADEKAADLLDSPNNTLAISYCSAMRNYDMTPLPILRTGAAHDAEQSDGGFASASFVRKLLVSGQTEKIAEFLPEESLWILKDAIENGQAPVCLPEKSLLFLLRKAVKDNAVSAASSDGFAERLIKHIDSGTSYAEIVRKAAAKHFPAARIRRTLLRTALGMPADLSVSPQYIRVLGFNKKGREILKTAKSNLPIITKPISEKKLPQALQSSLLLDAFADDIYALSLPNESLRGGGSHFQKTPYYLEK